MEDPTPAPQAAAAAPFEIEARARADEARGMLLSEFIEALRGGDMLALVSTPGYHDGGQEQPLAEAVHDALQDDGTRRWRLLDNLLFACITSDDAQVLKALFDIGDAHAARHVALLAGRGAFHD